MHKTEEEEEEKSSYPCEFYDVELFIFVYFAPKFSIIFRLHFINATLALSLPISIMAAVINDDRVVGTNGVRKVQLTHTHQRYRAPYETKHEWNRLTYG